MAAAGAQAFVLNISANTSQYNILTQAQSVGYDNSAGAKIIVNVASGVTVSGTSTYAMQTGALHADTTLTINITGSVDGYTGANGGTDAVGAVGGDAIYSCVAPTYTGSNGSTGSAGAFGAVGATGANGTYGGGSEHCISTSIGSGKAGGAAGYALRKNGRTITLDNDGGTVAGTVG
mgnify:CR=1 FL=1